MQLKLDKANKVYIYIEIAEEGRAKHLMKFLQLPVLVLLLSVIQKPNGFWVFLRIISQELTSLKSMVEYLEKRLNTKTEVKKPDNPHQTYKRIRSCTLFSVKLLLGLQELAKSGHQKRKLIEVRMLAVTLLCFSFFHNS